MVQDLRLKLRGLQILANVFAANEVGAKLVRCTSAGTPGAPGTPGTPGTTGTPDAPV